MTRDDLLHAIGMVDDERLARCEKNREPSVVTHREDSKMKNGKYSTNTKRHRMSRVWLIAAIIAAMVFLMGCGWLMMRLQHMTTDAPPFTDYWGEERSIISLQGFEASKNYEAFLEWQEFLDSYDPDNSILYANNDFYLQMPDAYYSYECYSWEMVDKIDEICEKYSLEPLGKSYVFRQMEHLFEALGIETVFSDAAALEEIPFSGYCFQDGTFDMEGDITLPEPWNYTVGYSLRSVKKTSFDGVYSSVGDLDTYEQWEYTMKDGTTVLLALQDEGRVIVDKEDCFVVVTAFGTPEDVFAPIPHDRAFVEAFCEAFDFSYNTQRVDPDKAYALQCEEEPHTYAALIQFLLEEQAEEYPNLKYALVDITGDGVEELLLQSEGAPYLTKHPFDEKMFCGLVGINDGELVITMGAYMFLCEDNVVEFLSPFEGEEQAHQYFRYSRVFVDEWVDMIYQIDGKLYTYAGDDLVEITDAEAEAIIAKHPRIDIEFKPVAEFPTE